MSHEATNWAFEQPQVFPDMKPPEWAVLIVLADCHNPLHGCFPSQEYIAARTNMDERTVRRHLVSLRRKRGLLNWDDKKVHGRKTSNRYTLAFELAFVTWEGDDETVLPKEAGDVVSEENVPVPEGKMSGRTTGQIEHVPPDKFDSFQRTNCPPNPVIEPVIESTTLLRAREEGSESDRDELMQLEERLRNAAFLQNDPSPELLVMSEPLNWLGSGCVLELDILPVLRAKRKPGIRSWRYFRDAVFEAHNTRTADPPPLEVLEGGRRAANRSPMNKTDRTLMLLAEVAHERANRKD